MNGPLTNRQQIAIMAVIMVALVLIVLIARWGQATDMKRLHAEMRTYMKKVDEFRAQYPEKGAEGASGDESA